MHHTTPTTQHAPYTIHHAPCTVHHTPCTIHHTACTTHHIPYTPYTINRTSETRWTTDAPLGKRYAGAEHAWVNMYVHVWLLLPVRLQVECNHIYACIVVTTICVLFCFGLFFTKCEILNQKFATMHHKPAQLMSSPAAAWAATSAVTAGAAASAVSASATSSSRRRTASSLRMKHPFLAS